MSKKYLNEKELSEMTGRALQTLRNDRSKGRGFPYLKLGKKILYNEEVVISIMEKCNVKTSPFQTGEVN